MSQSVTSSSYGSMENSNNRLLLSKSSTPADTTISSLKDDDFVSKTYKIRWLVLFVFFSHLLYTNLAWSNSDSIADLTVCYYNNIDVFWVNSLANLFFVTYVLFFIPATWFLGRFGLKWAAIVSGCMGAAGAWLRFAGTGPQYFWLLLFGQLFTCVPNILEWSAPALVSAVWFPPNERAIATALVGAIAPQVGILLSLGLGPMIFKNSQTHIVCNKTFDHDSIQYYEWQGDIYNRMFYYLLGQAIFATLLIPLAFVIPSIPPISPSKSKHIEDGSKKMNVFQSVLCLFKNFHFMLYVIVFGIILGVSGVYVTVYEEVFSHTGYSNHQTSVSALGIAVQVSSIIALLTVGKWIDFTKSFYGTTVTICLVSAIASVGLAVSIWFHLHFYIVCIIFTLTVVAVVTFQGLAYEFGVEMTFPIQEGVSTSLLNAVSQIVATGMTLAATAMIKNKAVFVYFFLAACILIAFVIQIFVKPKLRRVELDNANDQNPLQRCCNFYRRKTILSKSIQVN